MWRMMIKERNTNLQFESDEEETEESYEDNDNPEEETQEFESPSAHFV